MAKLPVIADVYRCAFNWVNQPLALNATNVMHFHGSSKDENSVANILAAHVTATMWEQTSTQSHIVGIDVTKLDGLSLTFPYVTDGTPKWAGTSTTTDIIPQACALLKLTTAFRGRHYRGRVYLPWLAENRQTSGLIDPTIVDAMNTAWITFRAGITGDGLVMHVASYQLATSSAVNAAAVELYTATVRKRLKRTSAA